jgi:exonuclease VII large subunit
MEAANRCASHFLEENSPRKTHEPMKFKAPPLTLGKRATLERTTAWLLNLASDLDTQKASLDKLTRALEAAESRKVQSEKDAALNSDAALALAGAEAQLSRLAPQVKQLQQSLERQTETAISQVNLVKSTDLRDLLFGPLVEQLRSTIAAAISPFFAADWAKQHANQIMQHNCPQYAQVMRYLNQTLPVTEEFEDAKHAIDALVGELNQILAGGTLIEV